MSDIFNTPVAQITDKFNSLVILRKLVNSDIVLKSMYNFFENPSIEKYSAFAEALYTKTPAANLTEYVLNKVLETENIFIKNYAQCNESTDLMLAQIKYELSVIQSFAEMTPQNFSSCLDQNKNISLASWNIKSEIDFIQEYLERMKHINQYGYGIFAKYYMFIVKDGEIVPVKYPDENKLENLIGYKNERKEVIDNTLALLAGKPAANVLLYGDAGTGKSSTVKAIVNEYHAKGLRIIEIEKKQLRQMPAIIDTLAKNPLKFILFIDDLSFTRDDDDFGALKAILEGSVAARTQNIVIYATSNRRHLVKESFSDRDGDDIHHNDTVQELISLSERFGITVNFSRPDKNQYIEIVCGLAKQNNINMPEKELIAAAEKYILYRSGRSPRAAKHFIDYLRTLE